MQYETPEVLATFEVDEIVAEAAVCTGQYEWVPEVAG
jgi:hypothetical protein